LKFRGKVVLVTGAASGMGRAIATRFAAEGASVVLCDVLDEEGAAAAGRIAENGGNAFFSSLDVSSVPSWQATVDAALGRYQTIDVLINNAGISGTAVQDVLDPEAWERLMGVNAKGAFLGTHSVIPIMRKARRGVIVNMSSISAAIGQKNVHFGYNASKAAITLLTKSTAVQFGQDGIRCNSVHPGLMPPMRTSGNVKDPAVRAKLIDRIPLGRSGELQEIVNPVVFLASDEASYITGAELYVDGGYTAA
jgi:NAD(P)-dependent dehydrogenase (short-subunit alcohol dehydrogenase family)